MLKIDKFGGLLVPFNGTKTALRYERRENYYKELELMELREENQRLREIVAAQSAAIKMLKGEV